MNRKLVALGGSVFFVAAAMVIGCAAPGGEEEEEGATESAITDAPLAQCGGNGNLRKAPNATSPILASAASGTKVNVYCKTHGVAPQAGWSDLWIGVNLKPQFALSYMHVSTLSCASNVDLEAIRDCSTIAQVPSSPPASSADAGSGNSSDAAAASSSSPTLHNQKTSSDGSFADSIHVGRTAPGTVSVSGWWTAYNASGHEVGHDLCNVRSALYRDSFTGPFECHGNAVGATRFDITYTATSPGTLSR